MTYVGIQFRHLSYHGPNRDPVVMDFGPGLNVIYGASNTGKSFIVETMDYMLGGKGPLPDIPQSNKYDRILLAFSIGSDEEYTIQRSFSGGPFLLFSNLHSKIMPSSEGKEFSETHSARNENNLSAFLLSKLGLANNRIRKNEKNDTQNLSFRNLARLTIVNEEEIIQKRSPLSDGNTVANTANTSVFKLLLTGVDDAALISETPRTPEELGKFAQIELLKQLINEQRKRIEQISGSKDDLSSQEERLSQALHSRNELLAITESRFKKLSSTRRAIMKILEINQDRFSEITILLERFELLRAHYNSDTDRLLGIKEAGNIFSVLDVDQCPVCGALPKNHRPAEVCVGDVEIAVQAAESEIEKIEAKELELTETIKTLTKEASNLERTLPRHKKSLKITSVEIDTIVAPDLRKMRATYKDLADKSASVRESLSLFDSLESLKDRKEILEKSHSQTTLANQKQDYRLTNTMVDPFAKLIQQILSSWEFPDGDRVHFDLEANDLVISGKPRQSFGKGLRAITQAAFTIALREYCISKNSPHPGFVVLDSPLLSYKEPDGPEDDLSDTNLKAKFYEYLAGLSKNSQTIVVENIDPPAIIQSAPQTIKFTGSADDGRFGLFPVLGEKID